LKSKPKDRATETEATPTMAIIPRKTVTKMQILKPETLLQAFLGWLFLAFLGWLFLILKTTAGRMQEKNYYWQDKDLFELTLLKFL
jgi:hypothetical protein